jgi:hypothetical protein
MMTAVVVAVTLFDAATSTAGAHLLPAVTATTSSSTSSSHTSDHGLRIFELNGRRFGITTAIHVLSFAGPGFKIRIDLARHGVDRGLQTPSSMCRTTKGCVAAVNGDFFDLTKPGTPDPGDEVGGIIQNCVLLHTPEVSHQQVDLLDHSVSEGFNWSSNVDVNGVSVAISAINQQLPLSYANVDLALSGVLLYTSAYGLRTPSAKGRVTYEFLRVGRPVNPTRINANVKLKLVARSSRALKVSVRHVDISAPRGSTLARLRRGDVVALTTTSSAGCDSIGGHPVLIDNGVVAPIAPADVYMARPYARTVIGWTSSGSTVLMTVDGKDRASGASYYQLVRVLETLHVVTAIDLDGGNSTTFFARGRVLNRPSRGAERPVSTGLLVVRT